ncbi:hypothetical protein DPMN_013824 [Dreissena polymorpha]|uniref:Uncharacterized protein n=1 Tax=Dreissena polymorpha TaxID=45954 RepID=A0A9D4N830_DREPO|nr:hypothetical protein DPMN_013824 [Dreissena polymorpha]
MQSVHDDSFSGDGFCGQGMPLKGALGDSSSKLLVVEEEEEEDNGDDNVDDNDETIHDHDISTDDVIDGARREEKEDHRERKTTRMKALFQTRSQKSSGKTPNYQDAWKHFGHKERTRQGFNTYS